MQKLEVQRRLSSMCQAIPFLLTSLNGHCAERSRGTMLRLALVVWLVTAQKARQVPS